MPVTRGWGFVYTPFFVIKNSLLVIWKLWFKSLILIVVTVELKINKIDESDSLIYSYYAAQALQEIAIQVGKKDWNFGVDPCNDTSWQNQNQIWGHCTTILWSAIAPILMVYVTWLNCTYHFIFLSLMFETFV